MSADAFPKQKFWPLFWTQFLGALNDNIFKNTLVVLVTFQGVQLMGMDTPSLVAFAGGIFILPYFLFSPIAGQLADKLEKSRLVRYTKIWELGIMTLAALGFWFESFQLLLAVLFLMGTQSTFFGPVKYSILPDLVHKHQLVKANAYIELGTFVAILLGTIGGGLAAAFSDHLWVRLAAPLVIAALGLWTSLGLRSVPVANPDLRLSANPLPTFKEIHRILRRQKAVFNSVLGISWFWFFGAGVLSILPVYCKDYLQVNEHVVTLLLAMFTLGIGLGSILCEKFSFGRVELGLVPIGSLGLTIFLVDLCFTGSAGAMAGAASAGATPLADGVANGHLRGLGEFLSAPGSFRILFDFFMMSAFGGFFIVPLYALIQERSPAGERSRVIAGNNILNSLFMVASSLMVMGFYAFDLTFPQMFFAFALLNALVAFYIYGIVPEFTLRFVSWVLMHLMYKVEIKGRENIPDEGAVILTCNHVSFIDWLILFAACPRPARFIMYYKFFDIPVLRYLMKHARVIPIAGAREDRQILENAMNQIAAELREGEVVCIFPEGKITRTGRINSFRPGLVSMLKSQPAPVVPMALKGLWGSLFSRQRGKKIWKSPLRWRRRIELEIRPALSPHGFRLDELERIIREMMGDPLPTEPDSQSV